LVFNSPSRTFQSENFILHDFLDFGLKIGIECQWDIHSLEAIGHHGIEWKEAIYWQLNFGKGMAHSSGNIANANKPVCGKYPRAKCGRTNQTTFVHCILGELWGNIGLPQAFHPGNSCGQSLRVWHSVGRDDGTPKCSADAEDKFGISLKINDFLQG
jgi:hypothetical protein